MLNSKQAINPNLLNISQSATFAIKKKCNKLKSEGKKVYDLGLGQSPFPVPEPVVKALQANAHKKDYLPVQGLYELREAVAKYHNKYEGLSYDKDDILIGPGSKELIFLLQLALNAEIILPTPSWVTYKPQADMVGNKVRFIHTTFEKRWRISPEALEKVVNKKVKTNLLILNYPGNPDGLTYSEKELKQIAKLSRDLGVLILSDEIYGQLHHENRHVSIARFYPEGTIISAGLSKWCGAGGWRLGTFAFPKELAWLKNTMLSVASETFSCVSAPVQYGAVRAYEGGKDIDTYLMHVRRILKALGGKCADSLSKAGIRVHAPIGAFYLFIDFSNFREQLNKKGIDTSTKLCDKLLEDTGVAMLPGKEFGRDEYELSARLAYVNFDGKNALEQSERLGIEKPLGEYFIEKHCRTMLESIQNIVLWVKE